MGKLDKLKIFTGNANKELAGRIAEYLKTNISSMDVKKFPDGEIWIKINENVRGTDVFIVQPTCEPVNENIMELLLMIDAVRRASARRITAVLPFYSYARQDRKDQPRVAISAKLIANLITTAGADRLLTMDLHAPQVQGFFDIPVDHLLAEPVFIKCIKKKNINNLVVAATDVGGVKMARHFAEKLNCGLSIVDKRRTGPNEVSAMNLIGEVNRKNVIIPDDMVSTAGTFVEAVAFLKEKGAKDIYGYITHPILCEDAVAKIEKSPIKELVVSDTIPIHDHKKIKKIKVLSVAEIFGEAINSIHNETSVSKLFK